VTDRPRIGVAMLGYAFMGRAHSRALGAQHLQPQPRIGLVRRAVIDEDGLPVAPVQGRGDPPVELLDGALLVQHRDNNRNVHLTRP